jgi:hypothetical protein
MFYGVYLLACIFAWLFKYSGLWRFVIGWVIADVSEERNFFFFFNCRYFLEMGPFYHWRWRHCVQSKRLQSHGNTASYRWRSKFSERTLWEPQVLRNWVEQSWHPVKRRQVEMCNTAAWRKPSCTTSFRACQRKAPRSVPLLCRTLCDRRYT